METGAGQVQMGQVLRAAKESQCPSVSMCDSRAWTLPSHTKATRAAGQRCLKLPHGQTDGYPDPTCPWERWTLGLKARAGGHLALGV